MEPNAIAKKHQRQRQKFDAPHNADNPQAKMAKELAAKQESIQEIVVGDKYRLLVTLGSGSFGEIYRAVDMLNGCEVAVKLESTSVKYAHLPREAQIYSLLRGSIGFPKARFYSTEGMYNVLVMDLLGPSLEDLLNICARSFTLKTTLMLADQILARVECLHMNRLLHRDIKPENFLMGLGSQRTRVFMIDFGLAKRYYHPHTRKHILYNKRQEFIGTARYASVNAHYAEQGRRDDLESVGYMLIYFLHGRLPWQGLVGHTRKQKYEKIAANKSALPLSVLCSGLPTEFYMYLKYCRSLLFSEQPDYMYLRQLFKVLFRNHYLVHDYLFDWVGSNMDSLQPNNNKRGMANKDAEIERDNSSSGSQQLQCLRRKRQKL